MTPRVISSALRVALALLATAIVMAGEQTAVDNPGARNIGLLWWPADPSRSMYSFSRRIDRCLTRQFVKSLPDFSIVGHDVVQDMLYPLMEPGTQPGSELEFADMLRREDARARLAGKGLRYLVAFSGSTHTADWRGGIYCFASYAGGGCLGFAWAKKETALDAVLWDLQKNGAKHAAGGDTGTSMLPTFIMPIPLIASTQGDACRELGSHIINAINQDEQHKD